MRVGGRLSGGKELSPFIYITKASTLAKAVLAKGMDCRRRNDKGIGHGPQETQR